MNKKEMRQFEIQSAMSTLRRAEEIKKDSKLMADVKKAAMEEVKNLQSLAGGSSTPAKRTLPRRRTLKRK